MNKLKLVCLALAAPFIILIAYVVMWTVDLLYKSGKNNITRVWRDIKYEHSEFYKYVKTIPKNFKEDWNK